MGGASPSLPISQGPTEDFILAKGTRGEVKVRPPLAPPCLMDKMDRRQGQAGFHKKVLFPKGKHQSDPCRMCRGHWLLLPIEHPAFLFHTTVLLSSSGKDRSAYSIQRAATTADHSSRVGL